MFVPTRRNHLPTSKPAPTGGAQDATAAWVYVGAGDTSDRSKPAIRRGRQRLFAVRGTGA